MGRADVDGDRARRRDRGNVDPVRKHCRQALYKYDNGQRTLEATFLDHRGLAALALALVLLLASPAVAAEIVVHVDSTVSETVSINSEDWRAYAINLSSSDSVRISVTVTFGETIDVYSTDAGGFEDYANRTATQFTYFRSGSAQDVSSFSATLNAPAAGTYYVVIDNAPISTDGAPGSTPVTVHVALEKSIFPWPLVAGIVATVAGIVIVGIVLFVRAVRRRRKDASLPDEPMAASGPSGPDQPPEEPPLHQGEPPTPP